MKKVFIIPILFSTIICLIEGSTWGVVLQPLTTFGTNGDGTLRPGDFDYSFLTADTNRLQRGLAYNPTTGHLIIVNRNPSGAESINVIDAATGTNVGQLDQSSRTLGGSSDFPYNLVGVDDDGAIYVGNLTTSGSLVEFIIYRWENEASLQARFYGPANPGNTSSGNSRWGDTLAVRGSGLNTEILIASRGNLAAILKPDDASLATFSATTLTTTVNGAFGYALAFGPGSTFFSKMASAEGNPLYYFAYDTSAGTATPISVFPLNAFPGRVGAIITQPASNLLAAIEMTPGTAPDLLRLYDISNPTNAPMFLDRQSVAAWTNANAIFSGAAAFGGSNVWALNSDNGIAAYSIAAGSSSLAPLIYAQPASQIVQITSNAVLTVGVDGSMPLTYQWQFTPTNTIAATNLPNATNSSLNLGNVSTSQGGYYSVAITNASGAVTSSPALLTVLPNFGNLLVYDPFAYAVGTAIVGQGGWTVTSAATNGVVEPGNLDVPGLRPSVGNRYTWTNTSSVRIPFGQYNAGEVYASFAFRLDTASTTANNETTAGFSFGTSTTFPLKINLIGNGAGGFNIGLYKGGGTSGNGTIDTAHTFNAGDTVFLVCRYAFHSGVNNDTCDLWINPDPTTFGSNAPPTATIADIGAGVNQSSWSFIDRFFWRWSSSGYSKRTSDELRVGFSWAEVTPAIGPSLSIVQSGNDVVVSWPIYNSSGYTLQSNSRVEDSGGWEAVGATVVPQNGTNTVTVPAAGTKFYRLIK